jgi:hypothetical protein
MNLVSACGDCCEALSGIRIWVFLPGRTWDFSLRAIKYRPDPTVLCAIARRARLTGLRAEAAVYGVTITAPSPTRARFTAAVDDYFFSSITIP